MTIPAWAVKGAKCVCIDDSVWREPRHGTCPPRGTVVEIASAGYEPDGQCWVIHLDAYPNFIPRLKRDVGWRVDRFRPLVTRSQEQDVALFKKISDGMTLVERLDRIKEDLNYP